MAVQPAYLSDSYRPSLYAAAFTTWVLATITLVLRFLARRLRKLKIWLDDWLAVVAWVAATAFFIDSLIWIDLGLGVHYETLPSPYLQILRNIGLNLFVDELFYSTGTVFMKLSLLAFFWRIFKVTSIRLPIKVLGTAAICWLLARYIAIVFHCIPVQAYWNRSIKDARCGVNDRTFFMGTNTVNFVLDLCVLLLPMPYINKLQVSRYQKLVLFVMFALGGFIIAVSMILLVECYRLDITSPDFTWHLSPIVMWAGTEINLGVVSACLPSLRPILLLVTKGSARGLSAQGSAYTDSSHYCSESAVEYPRKPNESRSHMSRPFWWFNGKDTGGLPSHDTTISSGSAKPTHAESMVDLQGLRPPQDRIKVRDEVHVDFSRSQQGNP